MRIDKIHIKTRFKCFEDFHIDIDESHQKTVFLGQNATGKTSLFEAIALIFKPLFQDLKKERTPFDFRIKYTWQDDHVEKKIEIDYTQKKYTFIVNDENVGQTAFLKSKSTLLPSHIFIYYSGANDRFRYIYNDFQKEYYLGIIKNTAKTEKVDTLRNIFQVQPIHSSFALMAFYLFREKVEKLFLKDSTIQELLHKRLKIKEIYSLLLVLRRPVWAKQNTGNDRFWNSEGLVRTFLDSLWEYSLAPIYNNENIEVSYKKRGIQERLYLFISDIEKLKKFSSENFDKRIQLFNAFESTYISDLIEEIRLRIVRENTEADIQWEWMSEGEQQLITVLGLLLFTNTKNALVLLDEPDTHLNPIWKWNYMDYLEEIIEMDTSSQVLITTHDPLMIGKLLKEQVVIFRINSESSFSYVETPSVDPRSLDVGGILRSEIFGLPSLMSRYLQEVINRKRYLQFRLEGNSITDSEKEELKVKQGILDDSGYYDVTYDPWYDRYLREMSKFELFQKVDFSEEEEKELHKISHLVIEKLIQEQKDETN